MKKFSKLLVFLLLAGVFSGCAKTEEEKEIVLYEYNAADYEGVEFKLENDKLLFELDHATTQFKVTFKETGKVWTSIPEVKSTDPDEKKASQSILALKYQSERGDTKTFTTVDESIPNGLYSLEKGADYIKVNYSIGKVAKKFLIPPSVPEERMMVYYEQFDRKTQRSIDNAYRKIDINNLLATDDVDELLAKYPDLETTCVFEMREATKDYMKENLEKAFAEVGYTEEDYKNDVAIYNVSDGNDKALFNVSIIYRLDDNELKVEVPMEEIEYRKAYPITELMVLPYFGASTTTDTGYVLVPEGSGAIINFNNGKSYLDHYVAQVYGFDEAMRRTELVNETRAAFPAFGIAYEDGAILSVVEDYTSLANIYADVAGDGRIFNYAYVSYNMIHGSQLTLSAKNDTSSYEFEKQLPEGSIKQSYSFLVGNSYTEMAAEYKESLLEKYPDLKKTENADAPISIELVAAVDKAKQILGMPVTLPEVLTSFSQAKEILSDIAQNGYGNLSLRYTGWMNGGIDHSIPSDIDITSGMGGTKGLKSLVSLAEDLGVDLYLTGRVEHAYNSNIFDGYWSFTDAAKYASREVIEIPVFSNIWYGGLKDNRMETHDLLRPSVCVDLMDSLADYTKDYKTGVGFEDVGYLLSADYNPKRTVSREKSMEMQMEQLAKIVAAGTPITMNAGNEYALPYATLLTNVDLVGKEYLIFDGTVPFYEMAIHGLVDYTGYSVNLAGDSWQAVLDSAQTGAGLAFTFIYDSVDDLQGTEYMDFFGANYDAWKEKAKAYADRYEKDMKGLNNKAITDYRILADGVTATVYEDNTVVYVNKTKADYVDDVVTIPARDYLVERSGN